jgi:hypothetical protein
VFRFIIWTLSELSAIAFAIYLGFFLFQSPEYAPSSEAAMRSAFIFCAICAAYWWVQSGTLALSALNTTFSMATDILTSFIPVLVVGYALVDHWRGGLPLSQFKQYAAYFALLIVLLDVTFNTMIMVRLSRRYVGIS